MSVFIVSVGEDSALVFENEVLCSYEDEIQDAGVYEAMLEASRNLSQKIRQPVQYAKFSAPHDEWSWDEIIADNPDIFKTCEVAEKFLEMGRKLSAAHQMNDDEWSDAFDQVLYEADEFLFGLMRSHQLTRKAENS